MNTEPTEAHLQDVADLMNMEVCKGWLPTDCAVKVIARYIANQQPAIAPGLEGILRAVDENEFDDLAADGGITVGMVIKKDVRAILAELDASKPDPLVEALQALVCDPVQFAPKVREHLALHGLHITEIEP